MSAQEHLYFQVRELSIQISQADERLLEATVVPFNKSFKHHILTSVLRIGFCLTLPPPHKICGLVFPECPCVGAEMEKMASVSTISGRTMFCLLDAPANAISVCRDATQVVVAGRNIFKIFAIEEEGFVERLNLRVGRKPSLNFSCADVMWHQADDSLLATAATNGAVVTWNLSRPCRNKQEHLFAEHKRTVNKVCFHPS
ncbi:hypothetical protein PHYPO_G00003730 [Pangasianodon hypophthalmus]|uniref:GATOR complex protein WDR24 n=1 Tax=Pangasianodon hypophthalmus TaxID=310915 RepID=A0A5N5Q5Y9_PANHP|nr:hypothetical protein PHYPO_G00003730 [Pangasianodon hypophthalmus]